MLLSKVEVVGMGIEAFPGGVAEVERSVGWSKLVVVVWDGVGAPKPAGGRTARVRIVMFHWNEWYYQYTHSRIHKVRLIAWASDPVSKFG